MTKFRYFSKRRSPKDPRRLVIQAKGYGEDWPAIREKVRKRDNYTCQKCGFRGSKNKRGQWDIEVHHKKKIKLFVMPDGQINYKEAHDLSNLITLCKPCHRWADGHVRKTKFTLFR